MTKTGVCMAAILAMSIAACGSRRGAAPTAVSTSTASAATTAVTISTSPPSTATATTADPRFQERVLSLEGSKAVIRFDEGVPEELLATIADTVPMARSALGDSGPLTVHVYASADDYVSAIVAGANKTPDAVRAYLEGGSHISEASPGAIWVWVPNFRRQSADSQRISIFHEYFHTVALKFSNNRALGPPTGTRGSPRWLFEGSARYFEFVSGEMFGYKSLFGATDLASNIKVQIRQVKTRSYGPLASYEGGGAPPSGGGSPQHELGALATDYLVRTYGMDKVKRDYWVAMGNSDWRGAFATVFGVSVEQFYADFEAYRSTF
jgi:hypothetical protein